MSALPSLESSSTPAVAQTEEQPPQSSEQASAPAESSNPDAIDQEMPDAPTDAPADVADAQKKDNRRKSAGGAADAKSKKAAANARRKSQAVLQLDAKPGDYFMTRMKGYPDWPSIVCDEEMIPEQLLVNRPVSAMRPDGTYRDDFAEGGKNAKERTYPVMFLATNEFMWAKNTDLTPLDPDTLKEPTKKTKSLAEAYEVAKQKNDLPFFKKMLYEHQKNLQEIEAELERKEAEKEAKKAEKAKKADKSTASKRKSKDAANGADGDVSMVDVEDGAEASAKKPKSASKKRKQDETPAGDEDTPAKKKINLKMAKTPNGDSASKPKAKKPAKPPKAETQLSPEEARAQKQKQMMYLRHKLQKRFLTRDAPPKEDEMDQMNGFFKNLEEQKDVDGSILRETKVYKVLRMIVKLTSIPREEEFHFKQRSIRLLEAWAPLLNEESSAGKGKDSAKPNGDKASEEKDDEPVGSEPPEPKAEAADEAAHRQEASNGDVKTDSEQPAAKTETSEIADTKPETPAAEAKQEPATATT